MLGKLVTKVLKINPRSKYIKNKPFTFFEGLIEQEHVGKVAELEIPSYCQANTENSALTITCSREYFLNGKRLQCKATFRPDCTSLEILGHTVNLNIVLEPNQKTVNGIIFLLEN